MTEKEKFVQDECGSYLNDTIFTETGRYRGCHGYMHGDFTVQHENTAI